MDTGTPPRSDTVVVVGPASTPCWDEDGTLCAWVHRVTGGNDALARSSDWLIVRPLQILLILLIAWIATIIARHWVRRSVHRFLNADRKQTLTKLNRLGLDSPGLAAAISDPRRETRAHVISMVVSSLVVAVIWVIAFVMAAERAHLELAPLLAGAGIAGIALGFGAQSLVQDCIAGLFFLIEDQFGIGDVVDLGEATGVVEGFTLRATKLRALDGTVWHVPNGQVTRTGNRSQLWSVALVDVDVAYDTDLQRAREILQRTANELCESPDHRDKVLDTPEVLGVEQLGADGITLRLIVKTVPGGQWALQRALREAIKDAYDRAEIEIPFPQRTIWVRQDFDPAVRDQQRDEPGNR